MKNILFGLIALFVSTSSLAATTYTFTGSTYTSTSGTYVSAPQQRVTGSFTTAAPLSPSLSFTQILGQVTSYSFSDGVNTFSSSNPDSRVYSFQVTTDGSGAIINEWIVLEIWEDGTYPHTTSDHFSYVSILVGANTVFDSDLCNSIGSGPSGIPNTCIGGNNSSAGTAVSGTDPGTWTRQTASTSIPTLSEFCTILLSSLLAFGAIFSLRRQRQ